MFIFTGNDHTDGHNGRAQPEMLQPPSLPAETAASASQPAFEMRAPTGPTAQAGQGSQRMQSLGLPAPTTSVAASEGGVHAQTQG